MNSIYFSTYIFTFVLYLSVSRANDYLYYSVEKNGNIMVYKTSTALNTVTVSNWTTQAYYNATQNYTGWDILEIRSNPDFHDTVQAYHAGYIEGFITREQIFNSYWNTIQDYSSNKNYSKVWMDYFTSNYKYIQKMTRENINDSFWYQVKLVYLQINGILDGYNNATKDLNLNEQILTFMELLFLNFREDLSDIYLAHVAKRMNSSELSQEKESPLHENSGAHCSAFIKILPGNKDVLIGHDTWSGYNTMNRILKRYKLAFKLSSVSTDLIPGMNTVFSSYPGIVSSVDDFYVMGSGIVAMETTLSLFNNSLYRDVHAENEVLEEVRNIVANRLANDGESWSKNFKLNNSGTYNNQWMIINMNKFKPGFDPEEGFLTVVEQMPGLFIGNDQTSHLLKYEYWASYNVPFYPPIYKASGNEAKAKNNSWLSFNDCPRAKMFKRGYANVTDISSMIKLMRYNNYLKDPYSECRVCDPIPNACNAISARCDLNPANGNYTKQMGIRSSTFGAIDCKIISSSLFSKGEILVIGGPTHGDGIKPFVWSTTKAYNASQSRHRGQPDKWDFPPFISSWTFPFRELNPSSIDCQDGCNDCTCSKSSSTYIKSFSFVTYSLISVIVLFGII